MSPGTASSAKRRSSAVVSWAIAVLALTLVTVGMLALAMTADDDERTMSLAVVPHPDDEFQMWSLLEQTPREYKVFVSLTQGEESGFCEPDMLEGALQADLGEVPPSPTPTGRWTAECKEARMASLLGYLSQMSESDASIPGDFAAGRSIELPAGATSPCRIDDGVEDCEGAREVRVWTDRQDRGAVVAFDLGDGDLTTAEIGWALRSVIDERAALGIDEDLRIGAALGAFANDHHRCHSYPHPDHLAVHDALRTIDLNIGPQLAATCFADPAQSLTSLVSRGSADAAFSLGPHGERLGAHPRHYGWLSVSTYPLGGFLQSELFMRLQSFWVAFN
ncbi:hypothetical protein [Microbacterium gallinarum]|uniref:GlcNAc-PI de-N-acetylase n=1 Tax=Microbacterium gallinarum TaxID=2762209 RepID=A0ABR8WYU8_9MICO|nr:hypothetical protein [Microbacterium gallinarum]MBD8022265.1 hypothetical protein [Microbacterium gallinarum]